MPGKSQIITVQQVEEGCSWSQFVDEITARGLVPFSDPLFVDEILAPWPRDGVPVKTVNIIVYADLYHPYKVCCDGALSSWRLHLPNDEAQFNRTEHVLNTIDRLFKQIHRGP
jgi:hypothetical protein